MSCGGCPERKPVSKSCLRGLNAWEKSLKSLFFFLLLLPPAALYSAIFTVPPVERGMQSVITLCGFSWKWWLVFSKIFSFHRLGFSLKPNKITEATDHLIKRTISPTIQQGKTPSHPESTTLSSVNETQQVHYKAAPWCWSTKVAD